MDPFERDDHVEERGELRDLRLRHDGDAQGVALGQDRLERIEQGDALRIGLVDQVVERGGHVDDDRAALLDLLGQLRLFAREDVHHGVVGVAVQEVPQLSELGALEDLEREPVHVAVDLADDRRDDRLRLRRQRRRHLVLDDVRREQLVGGLLRQVVHDDLVPRQRRHGGDVLIRVGHRADRPDRDHRDGDQERCQHDQHPCGDPSRPAGPGRLLEIPLCRTLGHGCARDGAFRHLLGVHVAHFPTLIPQCLAPNGPSAHG